MHYTVVYYCFIIIIVNVDSVHLVSCGADKSLVIQEISEAPPTQDRGTAPGRPSVKRVNHIVEKSTMYDMIVDPALKTLSTVGQDKLVKYAQYDTRTIS